MIAPTLNHHGASHLSHQDHHEERFFGYEHFQHSRLALNKRVNDDDIVLDQPIVSFESLRDDDPLPIFENADDHMLGSCLLSTFH